VALASLADLARADARPRGAGPLLRRWSRHCGRVVASVGAALLLPALVLLAWHVAARLELVAPQILPEPALVWQTACDLVADGELPRALAVSLGRVALGVALGGSIGVGLGLLLGLSRTAEAYLGPTVRACYLVPMLALLPFFMLALGIGEPLKIAMIAKASFSPLFINAFQGVRAVPRRYLEVASALELGRWRTVRCVILPAAAPHLFTGFRYALGDGWKSLVVVEMVASAAGIGYLMAWGRTLFQLDVVTVTMVAVGIAGWLIDAGLERLEGSLGLRVRRSP
jgi:sulfonate transport system permease protein